MVLGLSSSRINMLLFSKGKEITHHGYSHSPKGTKWHSILRKKMEKINEIGKKSNHPHEKNYIIGNCAEQHAGNNLMRKYKVNKLETLFFQRLLDLEQWKLYQLAIIVN